MFRHHDISHHHEAVALDKVQVIGTVISMQAARYDKRYAISSIAAHPCKKRKDGAPAFGYGKNEDRPWRWVGHLAVKCTGPHEFTNQVQHRTKVLPWKEDGMSS